MAEIEDIETFIEKITEIEYLRFVLIVVISLILAKIFHLTLLKYFKKISEKEERESTIITVLKIIGKPVYLLIIFIGLYAGSKYLPEIPHFSWVDNLFFIIAVLLISFIISRILLVFLSLWLTVEKKFEKTPQVILKIISLIVYLIAFLIILAYFDIEITPLVAAFGIGGLAIALALQSTLSNFFAGLNILSDRQIEVGDFVELEGTDLSGFVEDIGWRSTRIRTLPNTLVIIPNSKLAETTIINRSKPVPEMSVIIQCGVDYRSDLAKAEKVTIDVAREIQKAVPGAVKTFEPFIRYHTFGDSNIQFSIIIRVEKPVDKYIVTHEFIKALKARYDQEGIEISWPIRKLYQIK